MTSAANPSFDVHANDTRIMLHIFETQCTTVVVPVFVFRNMQILIIGKLSFCMAESIMILSKFRNKLMYMHISTSENENDNHDVNVYNILSCIVMPTGISANFL